MTAEGDGSMGQAPMSFFAPNPALAVGQHAIAASQELKHVIKELHAHDIEVILQVTYSSLGYLDMENILCKLCSASCLITDCDKPRQHR